MNRILFLLVFPIVCLTAACENPQQQADTATTAAKDLAEEAAETITAVPETAPTAPAIAPDEVVAADEVGTSIEEDIQFIRDKYAIISEATNYKAVNIEAQCDEMESYKFNRKYNEKGELSYLLYVTCGGHGCYTTEHYFWDEELIFIFKKSDITPGVSHIIEERRTYLKDGAVIRCLEKTAQNAMGKPSMEELLKKAQNKEVECTSEFLSDILEDITDLSVKDAKQYFCPNATTMLEAFSSGDCAAQSEAEFNCECSFSPGGTPQELPLFAWNWEKTACVKVSGQLNSLYPDWEERDYKKELKELSNMDGWVSASGTNVTYFGKQLKEFKYADPVAFLTDVILASGRDISVIPIQTTTGGATFDQAKANTIEAIAQAQAYKAKGGADPLSIVKMDNRSYDVIVRYRQLTQYEGEANHYEGTITLLPNRGTEILETRSIKGTCGC